MRVVLKQRAVAIPAEIGGQVWAQLVQSRPACRSFGWVGSRPSLSDLSRFRKGVNVGSDSFNKWAISTNVGHMSTNLVWWRRLQHALLASMSTASPASPCFCSGAQRQPRHFILHPSAWQRMVWDALSLLVVSYDVLSLPLLAFSFDKLPVALAMRHVTTVFWTVDIIATFLTGYHEGGIVVGLPRKIAMRYLLSTFLMDVGIVCVDWVMMSSEINSSGSSDAVDIARLGKTIRIIRLLRILRLFRVLKLVDLSTKFGDLMMTFTMQSRAAFEFFGIFKLILMVTISNHFLACAWYAIGTSSPLEESWLQPLAPLQDQSAVYLYAISFHWSMSQFTPAPNNFHPMNMRDPKPCARRVSGAPALWGERRE